VTARLSNPTGRNTKACVVEIGPHAFYFSYATCIAYAGPLGPARRANVWGPTTGRHFRELGCGGFPVVEPAELDALVLRTVEPAKTRERRSSSRRARLSDGHTHGHGNAARASQ
jgi:hypothetical protein